MAKKTIPKNVKHAFLIASYMGSVLKYYKEGTPQLNALHHRINQAMKRYSIVAGAYEYHSLANEGSKIWQKLSEKHHTKLEFKETEIFVEMLGSLMNPKNYQDFLGMEHFRTKVRTTDEKYASMSKSVLDLNDEVNELLGTTSQVYQIVKPKVKKDKKSKEKSKAQKKHEQEVAKIAESKARRKAFLRDRVARAKEKKDVGNS